MTTTTFAPESSIAYKLISQEGTVTNANRGNKTAVARPSNGHKDEQNLQTAQGPVLDFAVVANPPSNPNTDSDVIRDKKDTNVYDNESIGNTNAITNSDYKNLHRDFAMIGGVIGLSLGILSILSVVGINFLFVFLGRNPLDNTMNGRMIISIIWSLFVSGTFVFIMHAFKFVVFKSYFLSITMNSDSVDGDSDSTCQESKRTKKFPVKLVCAFEATFLSGTILGNCATYEMLGYWLDVGKPQTQALSPFLGCFGWLLQCSGIFLALLVYHIYPVIALEEYEGRMTNENKKNAEAQVFTV